MINKNQNEEFKSKENSCSSVSTYLIKNYPDIPLQKFDSYATAKEAFENGTSVAWANDNTEVIAFSLQNKGYTVGIPSLGSNDRRRMFIFVTVIHDCLDSGLDDRLGTFIARE